VTTPGAPATRGDPIEVRPAGRDDVAPLSQVLAASFADDPVAGYLFPSRRRRPRGLQTYFRVQMGREYLPDGAVFTTVDRAGAALWAPPGKPLVVGWRAILSLLEVAPYVAGLGLTRVLRLLPRIEALHPTTPHWYLAVLGTAPERQGHGVGSALLAPALARCDRDGFGAYLESSKAQNVPFYRRHGFEVVTEVAIADGPTLWTMWREPREPEP